MSDPTATMAAQVHSQVNEKKGAMGLLSQGYMDVQSLALDEAFKDTDTLPRQRLVSVEIDYLDDAVDCARCTFVDPDGRVGEALRTGATKIGDKLQYVPWKATIGYFGQDPDEMTSLTGVPMMESSSFPEDGQPVVTIKVMSPAIALQKNITPSGGAEERIGPDGSDHPLKDAIEDIARYYHIGPVNWGSGDATVEKVIDKLDDVVVRRLKLEHLDAAMARTYELEHPLEMEEVTYAPHWCRTDRDKSDARYLTRVADGISDILKGDLIRMEHSFAAYFSDELKGHPSTSDIKVLWGIHENKLIFMFERDYLKLIGLDRIPCVDYRIGNNLLRSFKPRTQAVKSQKNWFIKIFAPHKNEDSDGAGKKPEMHFDSSPEVSQDAVKAGMNAMKSDKAVIVVTPTSDGSVASAAINVDALRRSLDTDIKGEATTYGDRHLVAGNLIVFNGLPYGPMREVKENETQEFASYNRIYYIKQATHKMDETGFYGVTLNVEGCSMDGSDDTALNNLMERLNKGIERAKGKTSFFDFLN